MAKSEETVEESSFLAQSLSNLQTFEKNKKNKNELEEHWPALKPVVSS